MTPTVSAYSPCGHAAQTRLINCLPLSTPLLTPRCPCPYRAPISIGWRQPPVSALPLGIQQQGDAAAGGKKRGGTSAAAAAAASGGSAPQRRIKGGGAVGVAKAGASKGRGSSGQEQGQAAEAH